MVINDHQILWSDASQRWPIALNAPDNAIRRKRRLHGICLVGAAGVNRFASRHGLVDG
jgi:hypothetical protein